VPPSQPICPPAKATRFSMISRSSSVRSDMRAL
jgi:hypothetical protein